MEIKDMLSTGAMVVIGIIALKAFGGVKGLTDIFSGFGDLLGAGGGAITTITDPPTYIHDPDMPPDIVLPTPPPDFWEFVFPPLALLPDEPQEVLPPIQPPPTTSWIFPPLALFDLISPPKVTIPSASPATYIPTRPPVYQPPRDPIMALIIPSDPAHPATDPFLGGR